MVVLRDLRRFATQKVHDRVVAEMEIERLSQVHHSRQRNHLLQRSLMSCQAQSELSSGGMPHYRQPFQVQGEFEVRLANEPVRRSNVSKGSGPSTALIPDATVLHIERRHARQPQRRAKMSGMCQVVLRAPIAAVDVQHNRVRSPSFRDAHFEELIWVRSIGRAQLGRWWRLGENILGGHRWRREPTPLSA